MAELLLWRTTSRDADDYADNAMTAVAARQARRAGIALHAGEAVQFLVLSQGDADVDARLRIVARLRPEDTYDAEYYAEQLRRAAATVLEPLLGRPLDELAPPAGRTKDARRGRGAVARAEGADRASSSRSCRGWRWRARGAAGRSITGGTPVPRWGRLAIRGGRLGGVDWRFSFANGAPVGKMGGARDCPDERPRMETTPLRIAVIMAGGTGERFWPLSRAARPKQLLRLADPERSLLEEAIERIAPLIGPAQILVATSATVAGPIRAALAATAVPARNVIVEPDKRNTAGALAWAAAQAQARWPGRALSMAVLTADHRIGDWARFRQTVDAALTAAERERALVTIGVAPTRPETGYGYIEVCGGCEADGRRGGNSGVPGGGVSRKARPRDRRAVSREQTLLLEQRDVLLGCGGIRGGVDGGRTVARARDGGDGGRAGLGRRRAGGADLSRAGRRFDRLCADGEGASRARRAGGFRVGRRRGVGRRRAEF